VSQLQRYKYRKTTTVPHMLIRTEIGHMSKNCPQERREVEKVEIKCVNCGEPGHRIRNW